MSMEPGKKHNINIRNRKIIVLTSVLIVCLAVVVLNKYFWHNNNQIISCEDYGLELEEVTVVVDGMDGEATYLYMSDNQISFDQKEDLGWFGNGSERCYRDESGISSAENFPNWIEYANDSKVDGVIFGGDILDYCSSENMESLSEYLKKLEKPYLYVYGNHDTYIPWENRFDDENGDYLEMLPEHNPEIQVIDMKSYYLVSMRNYAIDGTANISKEALSKFEELYYEGKSIILFVHVPIYTELCEGLLEHAMKRSDSLYAEFQTEDFGTIRSASLMGEDCGYLITEETEQFLELLKSDDSPVVAVFSGHLHDSWTGYISCDTSEYVTAPAYKNKGILIRIVGDE